MLQRRAVPWEDVLPLERFLKAVRAKGHAGPVAAEVISKELRELPASDAARRVRAGMARFWATTSIK